MSAEMNGVDSHEEPGRREIAEALLDQYTQSSIGSVWQCYVGSTSARTNNYKRWLVGLLNSKRCRTVLDAACGTGIDSVMLLEEGFSVCSIDLSESMLLYAMKERWSRRKQAAFDNWIIEKGNWLTLVDDVNQIKDQLPPPSSDGRFDAVICLGNSFAHLPDSDGRQTDQRRALSNMYSLVRPGGLLIVDHRNYDEILATGRVPANNIYYNNKDVRVTCSVIHTNGKPTTVVQHFVFSVPASPSGKKHRSADNRILKFDLTFYPHLVHDFGRLLDQVCDKDASRKVYGDYKPLGDVDTSPAYYVHVVEKPL